MHKQHNSENRGTVRRIEQHDQQDAEQWHSPTALIPGKGAGQGEGTVQQPQPSGISCKHLR